MNRLRGFNPSCFDAEAFRRLSLNVGTVNAFEKASLVNFLEADKFPVHRWFFVREGFSPNLVCGLLDGMGLNAGGVVLDPFCGGGTTLLAAREKGLESVGFDVNPLLFFASKVKTRRYAKNDLMVIRKLVDEMRVCKFKPKIGVPELPNMEEIFYDGRENVLEKLLMFKEFILGVDSEVARDFLMLGWLSILGSVSNTRRGGTGIRIEKRFGKSPKKALFGKYAVMLGDLEGMVKKPPAKRVRVYEDSVLDAGNRIKDSSVDAVITSPPYPNCFDYAEIYKIELWMGDFVKSKKDVDALNAKSVRSHLNMPLKGGRLKNRELAGQLDDILRRVPKAHMWDKRIPEMLAGYFMDMTKVLESTHAKIKPGGSCAIVVGNVGYGGAIIPVDLMLSQIALDAGFNSAKIEVARILDTGLSQKQLDAGGRYLRESVISMTK